MDEKEVVNIMRQNKETDGWDEMIISTAESEKMNRKWNQQSMETQNKQIIRSRRSGYQFAEISPRKQFVGRSELMVVRL